MRYWLLALCLLGSVAFIPPTPKVPVATVYVFLATDCPMAQRYGARLASLAKVYSKRGVRFVGIFPNPTETDAKIAKWGQARGISFSLTRDNGTVTKSWQATTTPEVVLVDAKGTVRYRGAVDDSDEPQRVRRKHLALALDAVLAGKKVALALTPPVGCLLTLTNSAAPTVASLTYCKEIAPILNQHCVSCHRSGEVGAMPLDSYKQVKAWGEQVKKAVQTRQMPPWKADSHGEFRDEKRLSDVEMATLTRWVESGMPEGDLKDLPAFPVFPNVTDWDLGKPDDVFTMPESYTAPTEGKDVYRCFVIPLGNKGEQWVKGIAFKPGNRAVVHHASVFLDTTGTARKMDAKDPGPGYSNPTPGNGPGFSPFFGVLGGWTPGHTAVKLPPGVALLVPKNADLVLEVHYALTGKPETDQTKFGIYYANEPIDKRLHIGSLGSVSFTLTAGDANAEVESSEFVPQDITLFSVTPHMHLLGKRMTATAVFPDGRKRTLIDVPRWDFNWQPSYRFKEHVKLPRSTRIDVRALYDNSEKNPHNPNKPPKDVGWGESTKDEMCSFFIAYTIDAEHLLEDAVVIP